MKLYSYFRSSAAYRVRIALNVKGVQYDYVAKHLLKDEHKQAAYLALNPQGFIPALEHDGALLTQSLAIIEYLDEVIPNPALLPHSSQDRAMVRAMALVIACDVHPLNNLRVLEYLKQAFSADMSAIAQWYRHWIAEGFRALEILIDRHSTHGKYCFGDSLTLADVLLVPQVANSRRFELDLTPYPSLTRVSAHLETLPAFAAAHPDVQPDASGR